MSNFWLKLFNFLNIIKSNILSASILLIEMKINKFLGAVIYFFFLFLKTSQNLRKINTLDVC